MQVRKLVMAWFTVLALTASIGATPRKVHVVGLGAPKRVPYSRAADPAGAATGETTLKIRPLIVDGLVKEWTTGESHDVTDRSFVVRRVLHINDELPGERSAANRWVWQRGPWLLVDRVSGHVSALKLPDYDPGISQVSWFRDYAAYCGLTASGKSLYAVVAQLAVRKPVLSKNLAAFDTTSRTEPVCATAQWQRDPFRVTFNPSGMDAISFEIVPGSAVLVEDSDDAPEPSAAAARTN